MIGTQTAEVSSPMHFRTPGLLKALAKDLVLVQASWLVRLPSVC